MIVLLKTLSNQTNKTNWQAVLL